MGPLTLFRTALGALWTNKLRTSLTLLGIIIGVAAVISLMGIGRGAQQAITSNITALGTNLVFVQPQFGPPRDIEGGSGGGGFSSGGRAIAVPAQSSGGGVLTMQDAQALLDPTYAPSVLAVAPEINTGGQLVAGRRNTFASIVGTTPDYLDVRNIGLAMGGFIAQPHLRDRSEVAVLGSEVAEQLFGQRNPTGQTVRINGRQFTVLGVLESQGGNSSRMFDGQVLVPLTTAHYRLGGQATAQGGVPVDSITVEARSDAVVDSAMEEVEAILRLRHRITGENDFTVSSQQQAIDALEEATSTFLVFLAAIAGISLLVGGIGILNIMLVSVTERTREIGIRKAIGAKRRDILLQFTLEAVLLSLSGGGIGVLSGYLLARAASGIGALGDAGPGGGGIQAVFTPDIAALALVVSAGIGLFFGIYPAARAARLQPVVALRHD